MIRGSLLLLALCALICSPAAARQAARPELDQSAWELEWEDLNLVPGLDENIQVLLMPRFTNGDMVITATWAVFWMDRDKLQYVARESDEVRNIIDELHRDAARSGDDEKLRPLIPTLFESVEQTPLSGTIRELYLEGPVEFFVAGERQAHATAVYLDVVTGHGWLADVNINAVRDFNGRPGRIRALADWMRFSENGSLQADSATVTTSEFDVPPVYVKTKDLRITPYKEGDRTFVRVQIKRNSVNMWDWVWLPLPPLTFDTDEEFKPLLGSFSFGNSARFGSMLSTSLRTDLGAVGQAINKGLGGKEGAFKGDASADVSYLSSRGPFLDLGFDMGSRERFWWYLRAGGVSDDGPDRGMVRVLPEDRDDLRVWYRSRGRYFYDEGTWLDLAFSYQTDPAVQSEFWENEFASYEDRETYLNWRRANDENYLSAKVQLRTDSFRYQVERLPDLNYQRSPTEVASLLSVPFVYTTDASLAYLRRQDGDFEPSSPAPVYDIYQNLYLDSPFPDGEGEFPTLRFDNTHRFEAPIELGLAGVRLVPFGEARLTWWSRDAVEESDAGRVATFAGAQLRNTLWRFDSSNHYYELTPYVGYRADLTLEESGTPAIYDTTEVPIGGRFFDAGVRGRWKSGSKAHALDIELRGSYGTDLPTGQPDGWLPLSMFGRLDSVLFTKPARFFQDLRYDLRSSKAIYSLSSLGLDVSETLELAGAMRFARDSDLNTTVQAPSLALRYSWSPKWQVQAEQTFSPLADGQDVTAVTLRRFGHDFVFEIAASQRTGEGSAFSFGIKPILNWRGGTLGDLAFLHY